MPELAYVLFEGLNIGLSVSMFAVGIFLVIAGKLVKDSVPLRWILVTGTIFVILITGAMTFSSTVILRYLFEIFGG